MLGKEAGKTLNHGREPKSRLNHSKEEEEEKKSQEGDLTKHFWLDSLPIARAFLIRVAITLSARLHWSAAALASVVLNMDYL